MKAKEARSEVAHAYIHRAELIFEQEYINIKNHAQNQKTLHYIEVTGEHKIVIECIINKLKHNGYTADIPEYNSNYIKVSW